MWAFIKAGVTCFVPEIYAGEVVIGAAWLYV